MSKHHLYLSDASYILLPNKLSEERDIFLVHDQSGVSEDLVSLQWGYSNFLPNFVGSYHRNMKRRDKMRVGKSRSTQVIILLLSGNYWPSHLSFAFSFFWAAHCRSGCFLMLPPGTPKAMQVTKQCTALDRMQLQPAYYQQSLATSGAPWKG